MMKTSKTRLLLHLGAIALLLAGRPPATAAQAALPAQPGAGRPVRVVSLSFRNATLETVATIVDAEGAKGVDLLALPEAWRGADAIETLSGPTVTTLSQLARKHRLYVVCPIYRQADGHRLNTSVLIDRTGAVAAVYDKVYPYWNEFDLAPPALPGQQDVQVYDADFGKVGLATCFDAKFPEVFQRLRDKGAELVVWASAYSGFTELQAFALLHHYYIVTSTLTGDCVVYDITGALLSDERGKGDITVARFTLDMDRTIYHYNFNLDKRAKLLAAHSPDVTVDVDMPREEWFVLKATRPGASARRLGREYGLEELRAYQDRSRMGVDARRGFSWSGAYGGYPGQKDTERGRPPARGARPTSGSAEAAPP
jgi:predicted amidohydrolase